MNVLGAWAESKDRIFDNTTKLYRRGRRDRGEGNDVEIETFSLQFVNLVLRSASFRDSREPLMTQRGLRPQQKGI